MDLGGPQNTQSAVLTVSEGPFLSKTNSSLGSFEVGAVLALAGKSELVGSVCFRINSGLVPHKIPSGNEIFTFPMGSQLELHEFASIGLTSIAGGWKGVGEMGERNEGCTISVFH